MGSVFSTLTWSRFKFWIQALKNDHLVRGMVSSISVERAKLFIASTRKLRSYLNYYGHFDGQLCPLTS